MRKKSRIGASPKKKPARLVGTTPVPTPPFFPRPQKPNRLMCNVKNHLKPFVDWMPQKRKLYEKWEVRTS
jgi:hypothetical protein